MNDFFEIDFLGVETAKSGDAIPLRYRQNGATYIHIVDGGFQDTGASVVDHVKRYYGNPTFVDNVVVTHPDGDHAGGLRSVLESFDVGTLWMLRPWLYAAHLLPLFPTYTSATTLANRLRSLYSNIAALEEIATRRRILIQTPFQGQAIGAFTVLAPSTSRYVDLIVNSERTPETVESAKTGALGLLTRGLGDALAGIVRFAKGAWGNEVFSPDETSAENEMSVIQYANLCGQRVLLTGDAGRSALAEAADFAPAIGLALPGVDRFQVPHHGSRRNVSTEVLDRWLGRRQPAPGGGGRFFAYCSSAKLDEDHPRKAVQRAIIHRGGNFYATEGNTICAAGGDAPARLGWTPITPGAYPDEQEE